MPGDWDRPFNINAVISPFHPCSPASAVLAATAAAVPASGTVVALASQAILVPVIVNQPFLLRGFFWFNGATVAGNVDCGIYKVSDNYDNDQLELVASSGAVVQAGTNTMQSFYLSASQGIFQTRPMQPGKYWLAISFSAATATLFRSDPGLAQRWAIPVQLQAAAHPLPLTLASLPGLTALVVPMFGAFEGFTLV